MYNSTLLLSHGWDHQCYAII